MPLPHWTTRNLVSFGGVGLVLMVFGNPACADSPGAVTTFSQPLSWFTGNSAPLAFRNELSTASFSVPIPADTRVQSVNMQLNGWNSPALLAKASSILVSVNGAPAGIVPLAGGQSEISDAITLPGNLFNPGYNEITFNAAQTTGVTCEKFDDPALWTRIAGTSMVTITGMHSPVPPNFNHLGAVFDKHILGTTAAVTILYNDVVAASPDILIGAAEGIGLRYDYVPVVVNAQKLTPASLAEVMATGGNVVILAPDDSAGQNAEPAALSLKTKTGGAVLKITGGINAAAQAARLLGSDDLAWPAGNTAEIAVPTDGQHWPVRPEASGELFFRELGYGTTTLTGPQLSFGPIVFWNDSWSSQAIVTMHLTYGAGGGEGATMDVYANNAFVGSIPLADPDGGTYLDYRIPIPRNVLLAGRNELRFDAVIVRYQAVKNGCVSELPDNGIPVTLFSNSQVEVTGGAELSPDNLAALTLAQTLPKRMMIAGASSGTLSAAATLAAKLAQVDGTANMTASLLGVDRSSTKALAGAILVGPIAAVPSAVLEAAGIMSTPQGIAVRGLLGEVEARLGPNSFEGLPDGLGGALRLQFQGILGPGQPIVTGQFSGATVAAMASSGDSEIVLLTAANANDLAQGVNTLTDYGHWGQLAGHAAVITPGQAPLAIVPAAIAPVGLRARLGYAASQHALLAVAGFLVLILTGVIIIRLALKLRHRRLGRNAPTRDGEG